jgi:hypothetical protein
MFISKKEKTQIEEALKAICMRLDYLSNDFLYLSGKVKALEGSKTKKKRVMSPEARAKMSQMMKDRHAKKKLEKEYATSISTTSI